MLVLLMLACTPSKPEVPATVAPAPAPVPTPAPPATVPPGSTDSFGSFYLAFQNKVCDLADTGGCDDAYDQLNCNDLNTVPGCTGFDADAALLCLQRESTCDGDTLQSSSVCALVCEDQDFSEVGAYRSVNCLAMIACDNALAAATPEFESSWPDGEDDVDYGIGGSCYDGDRDACEAACASAYEGYETIAEIFLDLGYIDYIPVACRGLPN